MSPCGLDRNVPLNWDLQPEGDPVEEDSDEQSRAGASRNDGTSEEWRFETNRCSDSAGAELSASEKGVAVLSGEGQRGTQAWSCGAVIESPKAIQSAPPSAEFNQEEIFWVGKRAIRSDLSGRALRRGRWPGAGSRDVTTVDVRGGALESAAQAPSPSATAGAESALWGTGAVGWEFP